MMVSKEDIERMLAAFNEIQMARTPFELEKFVVGCHHTEAQRYAHCVLNLSITYDNLRLAKLNLELKELEIESLRKKKTKRSGLKAKMKEIEKEQIVRAMLGASREFEALYRIWKSFPKEYNRQELDAAQQEEFTKRLTIQAEHDLHATGRVSVSNQEGLRQLGMRPYPTLDNVRAVEQRYLSVGDTKILVGVPTIEKAVNGLPCLEGLILPETYQSKIYNCWGRPVDEAYNDIVQTALNDRADYVITIEDDTFPPRDAVLKLLELVKSRPKCAVGAWYPLRDDAKPGQGAHITVINGVREPLRADGNIHSVYTLAMGCSIYPIEIFMDVSHPWFKTTGNLSQDSFFSQQAREAGWNLLVDTSIRCKHIDRESKREYS